MRGRTSGALALCAVLLFVGCGTPRRDATLAGQAKGGAPAGEWRTDAAGNTYRLEKLPKAQARRQPDGSVRSQWGIPLQVEREDEQYFHYKVFRPAADAPTTVSAPAEPTAAERAAVAKSYTVAVREAHRLTFAPFGAGLPTRGQWRQGFAIADMNGDGHPDIVHGPPRKRPSPPIVFLGDGAGRWSVWDARFPAGRYDYGDAAAGDVDADGRPDVALGMHLLGMTALTRDGATSFRDASRGLDRPAPDGSAATFSSRAITIVDWDRDGHADILALGEGPRLTPGRQSVDTAGANGLVLYRGDGRGGWRRYDQGTGNRRGFGSSLAIGDFDRDGRPDAAAASGMLGANELVHFGSATGGWETTAVVAVRPAAYVRAVAAGDVDGDGRDDLVVSYASFELATWRNGIDVLLARADRRWERVALAAAETRTGIHAVATGDLDGDRALDVVALSENGETWVFHGDGRGGFTREREAPPAYPGGCRGVHVALADLDGDGAAEIVATFADEADRGDGAPRCTSGGGITAWKASKR